MTLRSSRTLPGQWCDSSFCCAARENVFAGFLIDGAEMLQKMLGQQQNVLAALAQRRQAELHHVQAVKQILAEFVLAGWPR